MPLACCESNSSADPQTVDDRIPRGEHVRGHARGDAEDQAPADDLAPGLASNFEGLAYVGEEIAKKETIPNLGSAPTFFD